MAQRITPRTKDFSQWYLDIIFNANLAEQSPVRGCIIFKPNGYAIWEVIQRYLDNRFKESGHRNAYFPMFIPESFMKKEKEHVEGFSPQFAVVTHGGGKNLEEPLIVRPTSETIINATYSKWIKSYRDLPLLINQWANVVRWEMRTRPFLRTTEFLWQEGHTCHATKEEAMEETLKILKIYEELLNEVLAIPVISGEKTPSEKFAGAERTFSLEAMMQDKKALQAGTSHYFGTRFAQAFDIKYQDENGELKYVHQTSWGVSTRLIGGIIMTHSDDNGLVLPPKVAPLQIVIIPIFQKDFNNSTLAETTHKVYQELKKKFVCFHDDRDSYSPGYKFNEWEVQGVPLRIELGPKDLKSNQCVFVRRDGKKTNVNMDSILSEAEKTLSNFQNYLFEKAKNTLKENTYLEDDYEKFKDKLESEGGFFKMHWCGNSDCELKIKDETKATIRCIPFETSEEKGKCVFCGNKSIGRVIFARNY